MKWFVNSAVAGLVLALAAGGAWMVQSMHHLPRLDGQLQLVGLQGPVQVRRDAADVTHIEGQTASDVWRALGFVHAQERGWQLEFNRRLMRGELAEILGPSALDIDKLMRTLGIMRTAQTQLQQLSAPTQLALQAYSQGIAQAHASGAAGRSPEFALLGTRAGGAHAQAWSPQDSVGWALMMALDLGGNWGNEMARFAALRTLPTERLWQLMPAYPGETAATAVDLAALYQGLGAYAPAAAAAAAAAAKTATAPTAPAAARLSAQADWAQQWVRDMGTLDGKGSNNWVIDGSRTASGKPLLANDPHLALSNPAIWYFARLKAPAGVLGGQAHPALDVVGATLPGMPFVVLGRTPGVAWGFTNTGPDVQDLYLEQLDPAQPGQYRTPSGWAAWDERRETIAVKGQADAVLNVRSTRHGPIISDVQPQWDELLNKPRYAVALRWAGLEGDNRTLDAALAANWANSVPELQAAYALHHSPMQSVVMADTAGQVAYQAIGRVPLRAAANDLRGVAPAPGWISDYDWSGWVPYAQNPARTGADIATSGWHATANQNTLPSGYPHFVGADWTTPERYTRITQLLEAVPRHDRASMAALQQDVYSLGAQALLTHARQARSTHPLDAQAHALLAAFDGHMHTHSAAASVLNVWAHELTRDLLGTRLGDAAFMSLYGKRHFRAALVGILERDDPYWCGPQGCAARSAQAMQRTLTSLGQTLGANPSAWHWGRLHTAISSHKPFGKVPVLKRLFDERVPSAGDLFTINVGQYWANDAKEPFANRHAASLRAIYDLSDAQQSLFIYQTGQNGHPMSPRSRDMGTQWATGQYRTMPLNPTQWAHSLQLRP